MDTETLVRTETEAPAAVKSAARVLDLAEYLIEHREGATFTDVRRALDLPASSCHSLLQTLLTRGYLVKDERHNTYRLSRKWARLALDHEDVDLIEQAEPVLSTMARLGGESVSLAVLDQDEMLIIHKKSSRGRIRITNPVGTRLPVHGTALGKSILAQWSPERLDAWLANRALAVHTSYTITSEAALRACLDEVRQTGVAYDLQESSLDILAVGAAVLGEDNEPVAAISIQVLPGFPTAAESHWRRMPAFVAAGANTISLAMGSTRVIDPVGLDNLERIWKGAE